MLCSAFFGSCFFWGLEYYRKGKVDGRSGPSKRLICRLFILIIDHFVTGESASAVR
jgi:hypothetical protein